MSLEEKRKQLVEDMLKITGPLLKISDFNRFSILPAAQTIRNKKPDMPKQFFLKQGRNVLIDMRVYLPHWAEGISE